MLSTIGWIDEALFGATILTAIGSFFILLPGYIRFHVSHSWWDWMLDKMMKSVAIIILLVLSQAVLSTPNTSISERQTLLGLADGRYYVLSVEWEVKTSHFESFQRVSIKQYGLDSNQLLQHDVISETRISTSTDFLSQSAENISKSSGNIDLILSERVIRYSGYAKRPTKTFYLSNNGIFLLTDNSPEYVLSLEELQTRIPDYRNIVKYRHTKPEVVAIHSEPTKTGPRYFLVVRSGTWASDVSSFEYVINLPEG